MVQYSFSLENFEIFILILVRVSCFVYIAPFYGMSNVPNQVKIGLSAMIALLVSGFADVSQVEYTGLIGYAVIVLKEGITGLLIGLAANVCNSIILFAGNIIDMDIGLSMATEFDPINNAQVTLTGNLYNYFILMLLVVTDMHHYILRAFPYHFAGICMYHDLKLYPWYHGEGFTADEYVCGRYADEDYGWICCTFSDRIIAAKCGKFHFYGNEKIDGTFYRRNVLTWNSRNSYI